MKKPYKLVYTPHLFNYLLFIVGICGVWIATRNGWAIFWTTVASIHITEVVRGRSEE